ncbi:MAG: TetR/AcrR family transcriptional regulator [Firmicutes bacterium]|nr:TetR/AcrR family transcriptional regulator [Lachnospiraceae bacterium]MDD6065501.1 TetR/AcrR family transcriptional regulator [Bacillota bacterium]MDY2819661.1 TetR/AcrR family transcriptional regulator [Hominisplanchenecus sp.]
MGKAELNKKRKRDSLLDAAFQLFLENGFHKTSISDIVKRAGVAKGTFYLYFTDKFDLRDKLISHKGAQILSKAYQALLEQPPMGFEEKIIFFTDHILNQFNEDKSMVSFLSKHLSWAYLKTSLKNAPLEGDVDVEEIFRKLIYASGNRYRNPEIMIYMIIELVSGTSYSAILYRQPVSLEELKPYLFDTIRNILRQERITEVSV